MKDGGKYNLMIRLCKVFDEIIPAWLAIFSLYCLLCQPLLSQENTIDLMQFKKNMHPPIAKKYAKTLVMHGDTRIDQYYWLKDRNDSEVIKYLELENAYLANQMSQSKQLENSIYKEIISRIPQVDMTVPYLKNGYYYYQRFLEGKEYPIYARKFDTLDSPEQILIDANIESLNQEYYFVGGLEISPDNQFMVIGEDKFSRRLFSLRIKNLITGDFLSDKISNTQGSAVWYNDNKTILYVSKDPITLRSDKVYKHIIGTDSSLDELIYEEEDESFYVYLSRSLSGKFIYINSSSTLTAEVLINETNNPDGKFKVFYPRERGHLYSVTDNGESFFIRTNKEALNFRLMKTNFTDTHYSSWIEMIPHRRDVMIEDFICFKNFFAIEERSGGLISLKIIQGSEEITIPMDEETYVAYFGNNAMFDTKSVRFNYNSLTTPASVYDYYLANGEKVLLKQQEVVGGFDPQLYQSERIEVTANDGVCIPVSLVYKKGLKSNDNNPLLLYGYGSYGNSIDPTFSATRLSLLDRGFVFAIAHIRGGAEMGRQWYEDGKLLKKKNTFTDFIDCARSLIRLHYTSKDHIYAMGGSAGGLLVGAVINMEPQLFNGVIAAVPFVDVVTTMLDSSIPLTTGEYDEWGNPNDLEYYHYMLSYSPYDNVLRQKYPNILVTTGLHDSQVQYWEPAKWVAKLRDFNTSDKEILLFTNMSAGHGGASGRFSQFKETAMMYTFLCKLEGIKK